MFSMHCLTKYSGISTKPAENLPFKLLVTHSTSFSVTGKMNMLLGQKCVLCCDIWTLTWRPFWFKSSPMIHIQEDFSMSDTFWGFDIISVPLINSVFLLYCRNFPASLLIICHIAFVLYFSLTIYVLFSFFSASFITVLYITWYLFL